MKAKSVKPYKPYIVTFLGLNEDTGQLKTKRKRFRFISDARKFALEMFRRGHYKSFKNYKGTSITL